MSKECGRLTTQLPFSDPLMQWLEEHGRGVMLQIPDEILAPVLGRAKAHTPGGPRHPGAFMSAGIFQGKLVLFFDRNVNAVQFEADVQEWLVDIIQEIRSRQ
ncbi:MAG: hypothetical protein AB1705_13020 [Verrucomicrobiota bacterium]